MRVAGVAGRGVGYITLARGAPDSPLQADRQAKQGAQSKRSQVDANFTNTLAFGSF